MTREPTFKQREQSRATRWAAARGHLPAPWVDHSGREATGPLPWCLPRADAAHNLFSAHRDESIALFTELGTPWHCGIDGGPGNNLLSSQVQCVNALMPSVRDPERLQRAFGTTVPIGTVEEIEPGRFLTFEYIGAGRLLR